MTYGKRRLKAVEKRKIVNDVLLYNMHEYYRLMRFKEDNVLLEVDRAAIDQGGNPLRGVIYCLLNNFPLRAALAEHHKAHSEWLAWGSMRDPIQRFTANLWLIILDSPRCRVDPRRVEQIKAVLCAKFGGGDIKKKVMATCAAGLKPRVA